MQKIQISMFKWLNLIHCKAFCRAKETMTIKS